eukprot:8120762-Alexandrium_andersonii.AAC.1
MRVAYSAVLSISRLPAIISISSTPSVAVTSKCRAVSGMSSRSLTWLKMREGACNRLTQHKAAWHCLRMP